LLRASRKLKRAAKKNPSNKPTRGERIIKTETLIIPAQIKTEKLRVLAKAAPMIPPIRACEDDGGNPHHQVIRSQAIAPKRAPNTTLESI